ncbi:unnamed protein product [Miscanthus lutarioriparius]|uniref:Aminotransferase-like plant mobile domain-containing protein n=1 Tax=Miscanthus lutarioriparius TaxID=422564 RepID=A0A811SD74_9POAL|nr:unnamed protein product [Miscanthus lutarioriparius]
MAAARPLSESEDCAKLLVLVNSTNVRILICYHVDKYVKETMRSEEKIVNARVYKRYADARHKLKLSRLEQMISTSKTSDDDFQCAFVLFTIGVILAPTTQTHVHWSYIQVIREVSVIPKLNWGQFTLTHILDSCHNYKTCTQATLLGNLALLQFWYWEHIIAASKYGVKYDKSIQPPLIVFWNETNAIAHRMVF